jgi:acyl carrier protein
MTNNKTSSVNLDAVRREIRQFILEAFLFGDESETFSDSDSFMTRGIVDSTGILELISFVEEKLGITVEDEEMIPSNLDSVDNLVGYIGRKLV